MKYAKQQRANLPDEQLVKLRGIQMDILNEIVRICNEYNIQYFLVEGTLLGAVRHKGFIPWDDDLDIGMPREDYEQFLTVCRDALSDSYVLDYYGTNSKYWLPFAKVRKKDTIYELESQVDIDGIPKGVWVDIFPLDNIRPENTLRWIQGFLFKVVNFNIIVKQLDYRPKSRKGLFLRFLLSPLNVDESFALLYKIMTFWNNVECDYFVNFSSAYGVRKQTIAKSKYYPPKNLEFEGYTYQGPNDPGYILERIYGNYLELPPLEERIGHSPIRIDLGD